jgi:hypothetical protein
MGLCGGRTAACLRAGAAREGAGAAQRCGAAGFASRDGAT